MTYEFNPEIEYRSKVIDTLGRMSFFINWIEKSGKKRSQAYFAKPEDYGFKNETIRRMQKCRAEKPCPPG